jgi:hypothetical protein
MSRLLRLMFLLSCFAACTVTTTPNTNSTSWVPGQTCQCVTSDGHSADPQKDVQAPLVLDHLPDACPGAHEVRIDALRRVAGSKRVSHDGRS